MKNWVILCLIILYAISLATSEKNDCPKPKTRLICKHSAKLKIIVEFRHKKGKCHKFIKKIPIKIKCPRKSVKVTKCINGLSKKIIKHYIIKKCECIHRKRVEDIKCPCPITKTIRKPCKKGDRKVITIFYVRIGKKCKSKRKIHEEICEKSTAWTPKYACQCYHYGSGNILTYDRRRLLASTEGKCSMLLSKWINKKSQCSFKLFAITMHGKFSGQMIYFKNNRYLLSRRKQLFINGKHAAVPHAEKHLRIFYSGEYLQFVVPKCNLAIAYNGHGGGYISVGVFKGHNFKGLCGNCNGNPIDDNMKKVYTGGKKCQTLSGFKNMSVCMKKYSEQIGQKYCGRLTGIVRSSFTKCRSMAFHFYNGCIKDVCTEWPNQKKMGIASCKVHAMAAEACSERDIFIRWRSIHFCPLKCPKNKRFAGKMNPCPKTCENHFFETSRKCFKLPHRNGCECKHGYVLDGNQCVLPSQCRCLDSLCVDRFSKSRCLKWRSNGRCRKFPKIMKEFCRQTCQFCSAICEDQVSSRVCHRVKVKGKCTMDFYKQMCRLTCFPESCKCPACETHETPCHPAYKYMIRKKTCYKLNRHGSCIPLTVRRYEKCGACPKEISHTRTKCNFCKGFRLAISTTYYRDKSERKKCQSTVTKVKEPCLCRTERGSMIKCIHDKRLIKTFYQYGNSKCVKCTKNTSHKVLKVTECRGTWITRSHCNEHTGRRFITFHKSVASNCKCTYSSRKIEILCKCPKIRNKKPVCEDNYWVFYQIGYKMKDRKKCVEVVTKSTKPIVCKKANKVIIRCDHKTCSRTKYVEKWKSEQCQCRLTVKKSSGGKCCCKKATMSTSMCLGYYIIKKKTVHLLMNNKCHTKIFQKKLRCRCPNKKAVKYCDRRKGLLVHGYVKFHLTKHHTCRKQTVKRALPVLCRKVHIRRVTPCGYFSRNTKEKYRKIIFTTMVRKGCECVERTKSYKEPCGCRHKKRNEIVPCPARCHNSKHCQRGCFSIKKWYIYKFANFGQSKKCIKRLHKVERKKCCCKKHVRKSHKCIKGKFIVSNVSKKVLVNGKCSAEHKEIHLKVNCPIGFIRKIFGPKKKHHKQAITNVYGFISHCKCRTKTNKKFCPWKCPKSKIKKFCNKSTRSIIKKISYQVLRGCKCYKKLKIVKQKVFCPKYFHKVKSQCFKNRKTGEIIFEKAFQFGCKCIKKRIHRKKLCNCPKSRITKPICKRNHFVKRKIIFKLAKKKCRKTMKLIKIPIFCSKKFKIKSKCHRNSGRLVKFKIFFVLKQCKCVEKKKIIFRGDCHCKHKKGKKFVKCDKSRNRWIHINSGYFLNEKSKICQKTKVVKRRPVYCHKGTNRRSKCNLVINKRKVIKLFFLRKNCQCIKRKRVFFQRCGCPKSKPQIKKFCDKIKGHFITVVIFKKWKENANKCIKVVKKIMKPIYCKHGIRLYKSKCNGKYYNEKLVKKYKNHKTCSCKTRIRQKKRNCHCPTKVIRKKCIKETGFMGKKIIIFKKWNSKTKKCHVSNRKVFYHRCKCPKPILRKKCFKGKWIELKTIFKLHNKRCIKITKSKKYKVFCRKSLKKIVGKCKKHSCTKQIQFFTKFVDEKKCQCVWRKSAIRKCKCCGCPKASKKTKCYKDKYYRTKILFFIGKEGKCSYKCTPKQRTMKRKFKCQIQLPRPRWTRCHKSECNKTLIKWKLVVKHCKCIKRKVVGPKKTCCCPYKPKKRKFCKHGKLVTVEKHIRLQNHKCKPWYKKITKMIKCKKMSKTFVKKCNRSTCKEAVLNNRIVLDHRTCKCVQKSSFIYNQPCCCKKKSYSKTYCTGKCYVNKRIKYGFNRYKKSCVKKTRINKKCIKCPKQQKITGQCNRKTCIKYNYHYRFTVKNCKCMKHVIKSAKVCCCPKPTPWSKTCQKNHFVFKKRYFKLHHNKCLKRIKIRKERIDCRAGSIKNVKHLKCDRKTCMKKSIIFKRTQHDCKCGISKARIYKKCCCPPSSHKTVCKTDKHIVKLSKTWHLRHHKCLVHKQSFLKEKIEFCKNRKWVSKCDHKSKHRIMKFIIYKPKHCKCTPVKTVVKRLLCSCPKPVKRVHKCNKHTCLRSSSLIYFIGPVNNHKCVRKRKMNSWKCCCLGKQKWSKKKCDKHSGDKEIWFFRRHFDHKRKSCKISKRIKVIKTKCPKSYRSKSSKCDKSAGYKTYFKFGWKIDHHRCKCKKFTLAKKKLCSCHHKKCQIFKPKCIHGDFLQKKKVCYAMKRSKCIPIVKLLRKKIVCPHKRRIKHTCSRKSCTGKRIIKRFIKLNCQCKPKIQVENFTCCCPRSSKSIKCKHDSFQVTHIRYQFNKHSKSCKKMIVKNSKVIHCKPKQIRSKKCDRKTCNVIRHFKHYKIINCKCKMLKMQKLKKKCCCPKNKNHLKCYDKYGVMQHVQYKYRLHKGTCVVQKLVEQDKISCNRTKFIRSKCNKKTKKRTIKIISHKRIGCKCRKSIRVIRTLCACKKPRIIKGKCDGKFQSVFLIEYVLKKGKNSSKCIKTTIRLYKDQCVCPKPRKSKKCVYNQIQIRSIVFSLRRRKGRKFCHMKDVVRYRKIKCPHKMHLTTKCKNFKYKIITLFYQLKHCKCIQKKTVKVRACHCKKRNKHYSYCTDGVIFNVKESYYSTKGITHCLMHSVYRSKSINCKKNKRTTPLSHKCNIKRHYSYFRDYLITWNKQVGCKCKTMSKKITKLCKCSKNIKKIKCIADDTLKIYKMTVTKVGNHCLPKQEITTKDIQCIGKERDIKHYPCAKRGKYKCLQTIKITEKWVENCKCKTKSIIVKRRCCVPKSIKKRFCDKKRGQHVKKTIVFKLTLGKLLYRKEDFMIQDKKIIKSITYQKQNIICPSRTVTEKCNKKTGKWIRKVVTYKRHGCSCKKYVKKTGGNCKCPDSREIASKCKNEFQTIRLIMYQLIDRHCVRFTQVKKQRCECPQPVHRIYCDGEGRWVKCLTEFNYNRESHTCSLEKRCVRWEQVCPDPYKLNGKCNKKTSKRRNSDVSFVLNEEKCTCEKSVEYSTQFCSCKHLNKKKVKCFDGVHVIMKTLYSLKKGQCISTRIKIKQKIDCPHPIKRAMKCQKSKHSNKPGYRLIKMVTFHNVHCKCVKRVRSYYVPCDCKLLHRPVTKTFCKNHDIKMSKVFYRVLLGKKCLKRTKYFKKDIVCSDKNKTKVSKCRKSQKSKTSYAIVEIFHQVTLNCKCIWRLKKKFTKICKCPPKHKSKRCVKNRIVQKKITIFQKHSSGKKCVKRHMIHNRKIRCMKRWKKSKCKKSTCTLYIHYYSQVAKNCKCFTNKKTVKRKCCCPKPTPKQTKCVGGKHTLLTSWFTFKLMDKLCIKKRRSSSFRVHCERREPKVRMGKCVKHHRTVYIITKRNHECKCINAMKKFRERCRCPKKIKFHKGKCVGKFAKDRWSALKFLKKSKKCVRKIIEHMFRRCKCPPNKNHLTCVNHDTIVQEKMKFVLQKKTNSCKRILSKYRRHAGCTKKPRLIKIRKSKCSKHTGYFKTITKIYKVAKNCKCIKFSRKSAWPCNCKKLHPPVQQIKCLKGKYLMKVLKIFLNVHKKCIPKILKKTKTIKCSGQRKKIGKCNRKTKQKVISLFKKVIRHCRCKWILVKRIKALCQCPKPIVNVKCIKGKFFLKTKRQFYLRHNKCIVKHSQINFDVKCHTGIKKRITKCDPFSGYKIIKKIMTTINKCQCFTQSSKKKCRCRCPKPMKYTICIPRTGHFKTTKVLHKLDKCKCISKRNVSMLKVICPTTKVRVTPCQVSSKKHDKYKTIIKTIFHRDGCKCIKRLKRKRILCSCNPMVRKHRKCLQNKYKLVTITKRVKSHGKCKRVEIDNDKLEIDCPDNKTKKKCNKKTGKESIMILRWHQKDCKCFSRKTVRRRKCKCRSQLKLVHSLKCNKKCYKVKVFKFEILKNHKCIAKYTAKRKMCCCPKITKSKSRCLPNVGMIQTSKRFLKLHRGKCVNEYSKKKHIIHCNEKKSKRVLKLPKGVIKIILSQSKRVGCKCKILRKILFRSWNCPKSYKSTKCVDAPESSKETVTVKFRMMSKTTGCKKLVVVHREPTECEPDRTYWTKCKKGKHGLYKMLVQISYSAKNCKCHKSIERTPALCKCDKSHIRKFCDTSKGLQVQIIKHFLPDSRTHKHCVPVTTKQQFKVLCEKHFKFSHKTKCSKKTSMYQIVSKADQQIGCKCKTIWRSKPCRCRCPKTKIYRKCRHDNVKEKIITKWILVKCGCKKLVSSHLESIKCPEKTRSYLKCGGSKGKCIRPIVTTQYKPHHCNCKKIQHSVSKRCCCPKSRKQKKCHKGHWITRYVSFKLKNGRCFRNSHQKSQNIFCSSERIVQMIGPCVGKKQKYLLTKFVRKGCKCLKVSKKFFRHCLCLKKSAAEVIFLVDQAVSSRRRGYQTLIQKLLKETVSVFPVGKRSYRFALVKYSEKPSIVFHLDNAHKHNSIVSFIHKMPYSGRSSNLAKALHLTRTKILKHSRPGVLQLIYVISDGVNDRNVREALREIRLLHKMHVRINTVAIKPSKHGEKFLKNLLIGPKSHMWRVHKRAHLKSLPQKILRTICKKACPIATVKRTKCSKDTGCKGRTFIYGYRFAGKQCIRKVITKEWLCCCPKKNKFVKICYKNRKLLVKIKWKFIKKSCIKHVTKRDISGPMLEHCKPRMEHRTGHCTSSNHRINITVKRSIKHCKCVKSIRKEKERCRCSKSRKMKMCKRNRFIVRIKLFETLKKHKCIKRRNLSKIPIVCAKPRVIISKCDRITCLKKIHVVKFFPKKCQCHHKSATRHIKCCCPLNKQVRRFCKSNRIVYHKTYLVFNRKMKTCIKKSTRKSSKTMCKSKLEIHFGKCNIPIGKVWYKIQQKKWFIVKNCKCIKMIRRSKIPCRCSKGPTLKKCTKNGIWKRFMVVYKLVKLKRGKHIIGRCKKDIKIIGQRKHRCPKNYKRQYSKCKKFHSSGQKYRLVNISWVIRKRCKCHQMVRRVKELCKCPKGVTKRKCINNNYQVVFHTWFEISRHKNRSKCVLKTKKSSTKIRCPKPKVLKTKCKSKLQKNQMFKTILYVARKCRCIQKVYVRKIKCHSNMVGNRHSISCFNILPNKICIKIQRVGGCKKNGVYRKKLCRVTCNQCSKCPKTSKIKFEIKYQSCLVTDRRYGGKLNLAVIKRISYHKCLMICKKKSACKSFDFYIQTHKGPGLCVLNKINPTELETKIYPHEMSLGATYKDLKRRKAKHCILNVKTCKSTCPSPSVKKLGKCKCTNIKHRSHCYRKSHVFYFIPSHSGRCLKRSWKGLIPCHVDGCNNWKSDNECQQLKIKGECASKIVAKLCKKTCTKCKCNKFNTYVTKCDKTNHSTKIQLMTYTHDKHGKCVMQVTKTRISCNVCYKKPFKVVHKCKNSVRYISTVQSVKLKNGKCKVISSNRAFSCSKCPKHDQHFVTSCSKHGYLKLITKYSIREKGCCRFKIVARKFWCHKCPQRKVRKTHCSEGYRLRHVLYFVRSGVNKHGASKQKCTRRVYTKKEKCASMTVCRDEMSELDCKLFMKSNGCHRKVADAYKLCRSSCGLC